MTQQEDVIGRIVISQVFVFLSLYFHSNGLKIRGSAVQFRPCPFISIFFEAFMRSRM